MTTTSVFDAPTLLRSAIVKRRVAEYARNAPVFTQGDASTFVLYIQRGGIKLSVINEVGKEAVIGILGPGDFLGEGCLSGLPFRTSTATAIVPTRLLVIEKGEMIRALHKENKFSDHFIKHMVSRNSRIEADLVDQLFNSTEKRLARTLLLLADYGKQGQPQKMLPKVSQEMLATMVGTTRPRINVFMNKFRKLGYIDYKGAIKVNNSLMNVLLHDEPPSHAAA